MSALLKSASRLLVLALLSCGVHGDDALQTVKVRRLERNPVIRPEMLPGDDGRNINGPSLIRAPAWVKNPLGKYYLYFAHHGGNYIRLAYADRLEGPWKIHEPGTLRLSEAPGATGIRIPPNQRPNPSQRVDDAFGGDRGRLARRVPCPRGTLCSAL